MTDQPEGGKPDRAPNARVRPTGAAGADSADAPREVKP